MEIRRGLQPGCPVAGHAYSLRGTSHFEDESLGIGRFRAPEDYQRRREKHKKERIEGGLLVGVDIRVPITGTYRFPFSEIEALGEDLENCRQMYYDTPRPSCAFLRSDQRGFTRHLGDLP